MKRQGSDQADLVHVGRGITPCSSRCRALWRIALLCGGSLLASACTTSEDHRWTTVQDVPSASWVRMRDADDRPRVHVYSFATPAPTAAASTSPPSGLAALSDHGQAEFLAALAAHKLKSGDLDDLSKSGKAGGGPADLTTWSRTVVISVPRWTTEGVADRLVAMKVVVLPVNFVFAGYSVVATDTKTIDIAKLETDVDRSVSGELDPTLGPLSAGVFKAGLERKTTSQTDINQGYENLDVNIWPNAISLFRQSERNLDLTGNSLVALTVSQASPDVQALPLMATFLAGATSLSDKAGKPVSPAKASLTRSFTRYPARCPLIARVLFAYQWRKVTNADGVRTYRESDDKIQTVDDFLQEPEVQTIVPARDVVPDLYGIYAGGVPLEIWTPLNEHAPLVFSSFEGASVFNSWMRLEHATSIGTQGDKLVFANAAPALIRTAQAGPLPMPSAQACAAAALPFLTAPNAPLARSFVAQGGDRDLTGLAKLFDPEAIKLPFDPPVVQ